MYVYHYSRLLPKELEKIKEEGLKTLSNELVSYKQEVLKDLGLTVKLSKELGVNDTAHDRKNRVFLSTENVLESKCFYNFEDMLSQWGG